MKKTLRNKNRALRKRRTRAKICGTAERPRLSIFRSNRYTWAQIIDDEAGKTLLAAGTRGIQNGKKIDQAIELGKILAKKAQKAGIKKIIIDRGFYKYHGRIKSLAESFIQNLK